MCTLCLSYQPCQESLCSHPPLLWGHALPSRARCCGCIGWLARRWAPCRSIAAWRPSQHRHAPSTASPPCPRLCAVGTAALHSPRLPPCTCLAAWYKRIALPLGPGSIATPGGGGGLQACFPNRPPYWALGAGPTKVTPHAHSKHHKCTAPPPPPFGESAAPTGSNHLAPRWGRGLPLSDALSTAFSKES